MDLGKSLFAIEKKNFSLIEISIKSYVGVQIFTFQIDLESAQKSIFQNSNFQFCKVCRPSLIYSEPAIFRYKNRFRYKKIQFLFYKGNRIRRFRKKI